MNSILSIRTQDRMALVPYDAQIKIKSQLTKDAREKLSKENKSIMEYFNEETILLQFEENKEYTINTGEVILGTYATKERALEVLDEIERVCVGKVVLHVDSLPNKDHWVYQNKNIVIPKDKTTIEVLPLVYEMPNE